MFFLLWEIDNFQLNEREEGTRREAGRGNCAVYSNLNYIYAVIVMLRNIVSGVVSVRQQGGQGGSGAEAP